MTDGKFCRYDGKDLEAIGTARQHSVLNDLSSLVVHAGSGDEAKVKATKAKEARKAGLPQRGQIDVLDETSSAAVLGKTPGKDRADEKMTYVALNGLEGAKARAEAEKEMALQEEDQRG